MNKNKFYITTPIYYINAKPHIGHAYTSVAADILARYNRLKLGEENVWFLTGTDEHGAKIAQQAAKEGKEIKAFTDEVSATFSLAWKNLNISNNDFIRTTQERHEKVVHELILKLKSAKTPKGNDALYEGEYEGLYCVGCERYRKTDELDENGLCPDHRVAPQLMKEKNWFFRLSDYQDFLSDLMKDGAKSGDFLVGPMGISLEVRSFVERGLEDLAISRKSVDWGIPLPWDNSQTIYVWVEALMNYLSALKFSPNGDILDKFWPADMHLMSKDIIRFHAVIWPAILNALDLPAPRNVFAHGFFTIDGQKMSKSLGNVIDPNDLVEKYGSDATRFLLVSQFGFGTDGDISISRFDNLYNARLGGGYGNLVARVTAMVDKYFEGILPLDKVDDVFNTAEVIKKYHEDMSKFQIDEALKNILDLIDSANKYIDDKKPWALAKENMEELAIVLTQLIEIIRIITIGLNPYMPSTAEKVLGILKTPLGDYEEFSWGNIKKGEKIEKGAILFPRIEEVG